MNFPSWFNGMSPSRSSPPSYFPSHRQQATGISLWRSNRGTLSKWVHLSHFRAISADILLSFASPAKWPLPPFLSITCAGGIYLYKSEYQWRHLFLFKCIYIVQSCTLGIQGIWGTHVQERRRRLLSIDKIHLPLIEDEKKRWRRQRKNRKFEWFSWITIVMQISRVCK